VALYIGGMGSREQNFYNGLARRMGYEETATVVQDLYLAGDKDGAAKVVPDDLVRDVNLIGTREFVRERLAAFREAGVTTLNVAPMASTAAERIKLIETLRQLV
jgi:alkanesulfonate monooxygenase SsuD/methylene tetrahydromethanopterin reductase-like flavin-dependent oxidoreductase (luciferase family)